MVERFETLYSRHRLKIARRLSAMVYPSDAVSDLLQETFVRGFRHVEKFKTEEEFGYWLLKVATNLARNHRRRMFRQNKLSQFLSLTSGQDELPKDISDLDYLMKTLQRLSPKLSEVLLLFGLEELTLKEIATELDLSINTVASRLRRGRMALANELIRSGYSGNVNLRSLSGVIS